MLLRGLPPEASENIARLVVLETMMVEVERPALDLPPVRTSKNAHHGNT